MPRATTAADPKTPHDEMRRGRFRTSARTSAIEARKHKCKVQTAGDEIITYGPPKVVSTTVDCNAGADCSQTYTYSTSTTVSTYEDEVRTFPVLILFPPYGL